MEVEDKFILSLEKAKQQLQTADHLTYITFPIVKENKLLLKILEQIYNSIISAINAILQYEYAYKRIQLYKDAKENFATFKKISPKYKISEEQIKTIIEILTLAEKHKKSPFEFVKKDKIVIMSEGMKTDTLSVDKIKVYITETKDILKKASFVIRPVV